MSGNYATGSSARRAAPASAATTRRQSASNIDEPAKSAYAQRVIRSPLAPFRLRLRRTTSGLADRRLGVTRLCFAITSPPSGRKTEKAHGLSVGFSLEPVVLTGWAYDAREVCGVPPGLTWSGAGPSP